MFISNKIKSKQLLYFKNHKLIAHIKIIKLKKALITETLTIEYCMFLISKFMKS